jgi:hypothetical protein
MEQKDPYVAYINRVGGESPFILSQAPNYPASGLVILWPYAVWEWSIAKTLWAFSNIVFTAVIIWCLFQLLPQHTSVTVKILIATLFIMGTPWRNGIGNGQHALFTLSFFLLAVVMRIHSKVNAGIPLAISWFKYTITLPLSLFFARSKGGLVNIAIAAAIHIVLTIFAALWVNTSPLNLLLGPIHVAQSATGQGYLDIFAVASELGSSSNLVPGLAALVILGVTYFTVRHDTDALSCLSTLSLSSMAVVFHLGYDFVVLVIPLSYALRERASNIRAKYYLLVIGLIWFVDRIVVYVVTNQIWFSSPAGLSSFYFWLKVLVFYGALGVDWFIAFKARRSVLQAAPLG